MVEQELQKTIEKLQDEIKYAQTATEKDHELLVQLEIEVSELLKRVDEGQNIQKTTINGLRDRVNRFEALHPSLTMKISSILDVLSHAGI
jgi:hypothetical protein